MYETWCLMIYFSLKKQLSMCYARYTLSTSRSMAAIKIEELEIDFAGVVQSLFGRLFTTIDLLKEAWIGPYFQLLHAERIPVLEMSTIFQKNVAPDPDLFKKSSID